MRPKWSNVKRLNSRAGCAECKSRRIKCDQSRPGCLKCTSRHLNCPGYGVKLKWKSDHQLTENALIFRDTSSTSLSQRQYSDASTISNELDVHLRVETDTRNVDGTDSISTATLRKVCLNESHNYPDVIWSQILTRNLPDAKFRQPDHLMIKAPMTTKDEEELLVSHYLRNVSAVWSCFNTSDNPFRTWIFSMTSSSHLIKMCILSMSAIHLQHVGQYRPLQSLRYLTEAISTLMHELPKVWIPSARSVYTSQNLEEMMLGITLIGVSTPWHASSGLGLEHIGACRTIFKTWLYHEYQQKISTNWNRLSFYLGLLAYWEAMAAFLTDQDLNQLDYLLRASEMLPPNRLFVHPWTGISTDMWIGLGMAGALARTTRRYFLMSHGQDIESRQSAIDDIELQGRSLEKRLLSYRLPEAMSVATTSSHAPSIPHLRSLAECCRAAALIELYRVKASICDLQGLSGRFGCFSAGRPHVEALDYLDSTPAPLCRDLIAWLALGLIKTLESIPNDSGTECFQPLILLIAGSMLTVRCVHCHAEALSSTELASPSEDLGNLGISQHLTGPMSHYWKQGWRSEITSAPVEMLKAFILDRLERIGRATYQGSMLKIVEILTQVWVRAAQEQVSHDSSDTKIHWVDVMVEGNLEFLF